MIGAGWLVASRIGTRGLDFITLLVLARLLTPADFGIVAIAVTAIQVAEAVFELPIGQVLVGRETVDADMYDTAFTLGLARGLAISSTLVALSFLLAKVYHDGRLTALVCFLSLAPAARGMISPGLVVFARRIDFRRDVALEVFGKLVSVVVACGLAFWLKSYWAIAAGTVAAPLSTTLASYAIAPLRPRLSLKSWPMFSRFLGWSTAAQVVTAVNWQCDRPILGLFVPPALLGSYSVGNDLSLIPEQALVKPTYRPLLSAFATLNNDRQRITQAYLRAVHAIVMAGTPVLIGLSVLAMPAIHLALGMKWAVAAPVVQWLALTLIIPLFSAPAGPLFMALGKTEVFFKQSIIELAMRLPITVLLTWRFGVHGLLVARLLTSILNTSTTWFYVRKELRVPIVRQAAAGAYPLASGVLMGVVMVSAKGLATDLQGLALMAATAATGLLGLATFAIGLGASWILRGRPAGPEADIVAAGLRLASAIGATLH